MIVACPRYRHRVDADRLAPHVRRVVGLAEAIDERLLILLFCRKAEPASNLAETLRTERPETTAALGREDRLFLRLAS